jgi:hypothetical protein
MALLTVNDAEIESAVCAKDELVTAILKVPDEVFIFNGVIVPSFIFSLVMLSFLTAIAYGLLPSGVFAPITLPS